MKGLPAAWHVVAAFAVAILNVIFNRGRISVFAIVMVVVGIAELVWLIKVRRSKQATERRAAPGQAYEPDRGSAARLPPAHRQRDLEDPDDQYRQEEEWLRAQEQAWTGFGFGCVLLGIGLMVLFVFLVVVFAIAPASLK